MNGNKDQYHIHNDMVPLPDRRKIHEVQKPSAEYCPDRPGFTDRVYGETGSDFKEEQEEQDKV